MAMAPMIVIGCGGSGGKVVASLRRSLEIQLQSVDWTEGIPDAWQLIYVDTPAAQEVDLTYGPAVPPADYVSLSLGMNQYRDVDTSVMTAVGSDGLDRFVGWRPTPSAQVAVNLGAGQWRAIGRMAAFNGMRKVSERVTMAMGKISGGESQLQRLGVKLGYGDAPVASTPFVVIVSSLAGGTGAGIFLDVADVVRATRADLYNQIAGVLFTAEVFRNLNNTPGVYPNTLAAISELTAAYSSVDSEFEPLYRKLGVNVQQRAQGKTGINYPFIVGMSTLGGRQLANIPDAYRAVSETLAAAMVSPEVHQSLLASQVGNWPVNLQTNLTSWDFGHAPRADGVRVESGVVSSFGSARLSVGVARFGEYARARLARQVIDYLSDGYIDQGRGLMNDPQATPEQIIDYFVADLGIRFVEACGLRELNDAVDEAEHHDQVLEAVLPNQRIEDQWRTWWQSMHTELTAGSPRSLVTSVWSQQIADLVPRRVVTFRQGIEAELQAGVTALMSTLPQRVLTQVSQYMAQYGVQVTLALVQYAMGHVKDAVNELRGEAAHYRSLGARSTEQIAAAWQGLTAKQELPPQHETVREATRRGSSIGLREAQALHREQTGQFLTRFHDQVLVRLEQQLRQIQGQLGSDDARTAVRSWPLDEGVPVSFAPPPLESCLVSPETWPDLFDQLLRETAASEPGQRGPAEEVVRRIVGGGGFAYEMDGQPITYPPALALEQEWTGGPVQLSVSLGVDDIEERARVWLTRRGTIFGDFLRQKLGTYLSPVGPGGVPVADFNARLDRFRDGLQRTLASATPLVAINPAMFTRIHPESIMGNGRMTKLISEKLPFTSGPAYDAARQILEANVTSSEEELRRFFGDATADHEGVLYVSMLEGAVHPAAITSLTQPIQTFWNGVRNNTASVGLFWQNRRARRLEEFVPVAPSVLEQMISGWFVGRLLGRISDPDPVTGFSIAYMGDNGPRTAPFPWPLLPAGRLDLSSRSHRNQWLPALLESIGLAYVLFATEPDILVGYDKMYLLGDGEALERWVETGEAGPQAPGAKCQLQGADLESRKEAAESGLRAMAADFERHITSQRILVDPNEFFTIPYGFELWSMYQGAFNRLEQRLAGLDTAGGLG